MKKAIISFVVLLVVGCGLLWATADRDMRRLALNFPTNTDVLFWSTPQRDAGGHDQRLRLRWPHLGAHLAAAVGRAAVVEEVERDGEAEADRGGRPRDRRQGSP